MNCTFIKNLQKFEDKLELNHFQKIKRGFEKEALRVSANAIGSEHIKLALTPHSKLLGSALTHPLITTDYSESLLEIITPPTTSRATLFENLQDSKQFVYHILNKQKECLWVASMPCELPEEKNIPIANYGHSNYGQLKTIYRRGLGLRYSRSMQTIAGIHYNFSLPDVFFAKLRELYNSSLTLKDFISEQYLKLIRNCFRFGYILPMVFGASPAANQNFVKNDSLDLKNDLPDTLYGEYFTSLRLSDVGYSNKTESLINISYNSVTEFINTLRRSIHTVYPEYTRLGIKSNGEYQQLSDCLLQVEDEHYAIIRPKRVTEPEERMLHAIEQKGIEYIEVRVIDINPYSPLGIEKESVHFLDSFLLFCLLSDSPALMKEETKEIHSNMNKVLKNGRKPNLTLDMYGKTILFEDWCNEILRSIEKAAELLDKGYGIHFFTESCQKVRGQLQFNKDLLCSAQILEEMKKNNLSHQVFINQLSKAHQNYFLTTPFPKEKKEYFIYLASQSLQKQLDLEANNAVSLEQYIRNYLEN